MIVDGNVIEKSLLDKNCTISVKDIYTKIKEKKKISTIIFQNKYCSIKLQDIKEDFYLLQIYDKIKEKNEIIKLLIKPLEIYSQENQNKKILDIITLKQFKKIKQNYANHIFSCEKEGKDEKFSELLFGNIIKHIYCKNKHFIKNINKKNMDEKNFNSYFKKISLNTDFQSVYDFEKHYDDYFTESKYVNKNNYKFKFYQISNANRKELRDNFKYVIEEESPFLFFGNPGMGKSVTLIYTLKYAYDHDIYGTLYIHCKSLYNLFQNNYEKAKSLLKEEIVYLFKNEYKEYILCCDEIDNFLIKQNTKFWDLIKTIEKCLTYNNKKYLFAFDQYYEDNFDPENKGIKSILSENNKNLNIIAICSMDDKRIKNYKINKFLMINPAGNIFITKEVDNLLDMKNMSIDDDSIFDQTLERIGKTIKNYNILKYIHDNQDENALDNYVNDLKAKMKDYLIKFYKLDEKLDYNFLKCWTNTFYKINYLDEIKDFISFKYFDIRKNRNNRDEFEIIYLYPIVEEIMTEILSHIFYKNTKLNTIIGLLGIDGGAKGCVFEKFIIHKMKPDVQDKLLFNCFRINKVIKCEKFVPKQNEKSDNFKKSKELLGKGIYLFEQRIFGGKAFDTAIIEIKGNRDKYAYLFQISLKRTFEKIFTLSKLKENIISFVKYFKDVYGLIFNEVYFTYIFDYTNMEEMVDICSMREMPYMFFETKNENFVDSDGKEVELDNDNINKYFICPIEFTPKINIFHRANIVGLLNTKQEDSIINFIKKEKYFGMKNKKVYINIINEKIDDIIEKGEQKKRIFLLKLGREEAQNYYYSIYQTDKTFAKKNKDNFEKNNLLLFYISAYNNAVCFILLFDGKIYQLNFTPGTLLYNKNYYCYEVFTY